MKLCHLFIYLYIKQHTKEKKNLYGKYYNSQVKYEACKLRRATNV